MIAGVIALGMPVTPDSARITVPVSLDHAPLRYQFAVRMPQVAPHRALMLRLRNAGFTEIAFYHLGGTQVCKIPHTLDDFHNRHKGQRCFIVGNGPSLNHIDMAKLKGEITLGANRCFLGFEQWGYAFTYWGVYDPLQIEEYGAEYAAQVPPETVKFFPFPYLPLLDVENGCPVPMDWPRERWRQFSDTPDRLYFGYSVLFMLLQAAAVMGCDPIVFVGLDHEYHIHKPYLHVRMARMAGRWLAKNFDGTTWYRAANAVQLEYFKAKREAAPPAYRIWEADEAHGPTHFDSRYTAERKRFLMPRPKDAEADYACALRWAQGRGVKILNATPGSRLEVFPKVDFESLF